MSARLLPQQRARLSPRTARFSGLSPEALAALTSPEPAAEQPLPRNSEPRGASPGREAASISSVPREETRRKFIAAIASIRYFFAGIAPEIPVPDLRGLEQAGVDFAALALGEDSFAAAGMESALVLAPVNLSLETWRRIYSSLRAWQEINDSQSPYRLQEQRGKQRSGDGLWALDYIADHYSRFIMDDLDSPAPTRVTLDGPAQAALDNAGNPSQKIIWQTALVPLGDRVLEESPPDSWAPIGLYLTLQAERLFRKKSPVDLEGSTVLIPRRRWKKDAWIPRGSFGAIKGQVYLYGYESGQEFPEVDWGNFRAPVWG